MKKTVYTTLILSGLLMAVDYKTVFNETVALDIETKVKVQLLQEDKDYDLSHSAKVKIKSMDGEKLFSFFDNDSNSPIYDFGEIKLNKKIKNKKLIDLKSAVTVLDMDGNGKNEIIIYGEYYEPMIEHGEGKLLILEENSRGIEQKMPMVLGYDYYEMKFYPKEKLLIVAQHKVSSEKKGLNNHYLYEFNVYDMKASFKKLPIFLSKKRIESKGKQIIDKNLPEILAKYHKYKKGKVSKVKELNLITFVKSYWNTISNNDGLDFIEQHLKDEVLYYNKKISKTSFLKKKQNSLKKIKSIEFELNNFLVYQKDAKYYVEYLKFSTHDDLKFSYVKSLMVIDEVDGKFMIETEKDLRIISVSSN